jgi:hypothetical protein
MAQDKRRRRFWAALLVVSLVLVGLAALPAVAASAQSDSTCGLTASISVDPTSGDAGSQTVVTGSQFCTDTSVAIRFADADGIVYQLAFVPVAPDNTFSATVTIPNDAAIGVGTVRAYDRMSRQCAFAAFEVTAPG